MNQTIIQFPYRVCLKCNYEKQMAQTVCPQCGRLMQTKLNIRRRGALMTLLGGFLVMFMSWISFYTFSLIQQSNQPGTSARFTGSSNDAVMIFGLFGFVILFGVVSLITGLWQLIFGKRNKFLVYAVLAIGVGLYIGSFFIRSYFGNI